MFLAQTTPRILAMLLAAAAAGTLSPRAVAHNGGILIQGQDGKLVLGLDSEQPGEPPLLGEFVESSLLRPELVGQDVPSFLSLATPPAGTEALPEGTDIHWDFLPMTIDGATSNLFYWDGQGTGSDDVQFGSLPQQGVTMGIYNVTDPGNPSEVVSGTDQMVPGKLIGKTDSSGSGLRLHRHNYFLLEDGDGQLPNDVPEGAYLIAFQLRMEGYRASDPFFLVAGTYGLASSSLESVDAAVSWVKESRDTLIRDGDYDFDGDVDGADYLAWKNQFGSAGPFPVDGAYADGNRDGLVNAADYVLWRNHLTVGPRAAGQVPEPSALAIAAWATLLGVLKRRRA